MTKDVLCDFATHTHFDIDAGVWTHVTDYSKRQSIKNIHIYIYTYKTGGKPKGLFHTKACHLEARKHHWLYHMICYQWPTYSVFAKYVVNKSMKVVIGFCRHDSSWDKYLITVKCVVRLLAWENKVHHRTGNERQAAVLGFMYHHQWRWILGSLDLTVYRKPTHTDQYLNFVYNHHLQQKRSVVRMLVNRANYMVTKPEQKDAEVRLVKSTLRAIGYKEWAFKIAPPKNKSETSYNTTGARPAPAWAYLISEVHQN